MNDGSAAAGVGRPINDFADSSEFEYAIHDDRAALSELSDHPLLTADEEKMLGRMIQAGDVQAKHRLVSCNARLVISEARRLHATTGFSGRYGARVAGGPELVDLVQEGMLGLNRAAEKFNPELGFKFSTFACRHVLNSMYRLMDNTERSIRRPIQVAQTQRKLWKLESERTANGNTEILSDAEAAQILDLGEADIRRAREAARVTASLDQPLNSAESDGTLGSIIADSLAHVDVDEDAFTSAEIAAAVGRLSERDQKIIEARHVHQLSLEDASKRVGVSRETLRKQEPRALARLGYQLKKGVEVKVQNGRPPEKRKVAGQLQGLLERLPETDRRAIELRHVDQLSPRAAAKAMDLSESEFAAVHKTALTKLKRLAEFAKARSHTNPSAGRSL